MPPSMPTDRPKSFCPQLVAAAAAVSPVDQADALLHSGPPLEAHAVPGPSYFDFRGDGITPGALAAEQAAAGHLRHHPRKM